MKIQKISAVLLKGLLAHSANTPPAWRAGVAVISSRFGGDYKMIKGAK